MPDSGHVLRRPISLMAADAAAGTLTLAIQPKGAGTQTLTLECEYPVRGDATYQLRVRALSSSGAVIETLTEPASARRRMLTA